jgi:CheY-like chemotaxis protein
MGPIVMLLAEDNLADMFFFREALTAAELYVQIEVAKSGDEVIRFLRHQQPFENCPRADVVVLDLNMPIKNGREVLAEMATDPALNTIPVAILTTSTSERSLCEGYLPGRCVYFSITDEFGRLIEIVRQIAALARR